MDILDQCYLDSSLVATALSVVDIVDQYYPDNSLGLEMASMLGQFSLLKTVRNEDPYFLYNISLEVARLQFGILDLESLGSIEVVVDL